MDLKVLFLFIHRNQIFDVLKFKFCIEAFDTSKN